MKRPTLDELTQQLHDSTNNCINKVWALRLGLLPTRGDTMKKNSEEKLSEKEVEELIQTTDNLFENCPHDITQFLPNSDGPMCICRCMICGLLIEPKTLSQLEIDIIVGRGAK